MRFYWLLLASLAVWRITHLLNAENGPWDVVVRFRRALGNGQLGKMVDCFYCLSIWVAVPFSLLLGERWTERLLLWPALSGSAALLERISAMREHHDKEEGDVVLRTEASVNSDFEQDTEDG